AGSTASVFFIADPLSLASAHLDIVFARDALTRILGTEEVAADLAMSLDDDSTALRTGTLEVGTGAADLLCDLWSGKAEIHVALPGTAGARDYTGETVLSGLVQR